MALYEKIKRTKLQNGNPSDHLIHVWCTSVTSENICRDSKGIVSLIWSVRKALFKRKQWKLIKTKIGYYLTI